MKIVVGVSPPIVQYMNPKNKLKNKNEHMD
jgi:hypothetical protein